jgi:hypothetical protein
LSRTSEPRGDGRAGLTDGCVGANSTTASRCCRTPDLAAPRGFPLPRAPRVPTGSATSITACRTPRSRSRCCTTA